MNHLSPDQLSALLDDALMGEPLADARRHLSDCADCRTAFAKLQAQDDALFAARAHMPDDAYFDTFAARVEARVDALGMPAAGERADDSRPLEGTPPPRRAGAPWWGTWVGWFQSPARLAWAGGVAVLVVGAGIVFMTTRETAVMQMRDTQAQGALDQAQKTEELRSPSAQKRAGSAEGNVDTDALGEAREGDNFRQDAAPPARVREMRRTESGEDVPVDRKAPTFAQEPSRDAPASSAPGEPAYVRKPQVATPLGGRTAEEREAPAVGAESKDTATKESSNELAVQSKIVGTQVCGEVHDAANRPLAGAQVALADRGLTTSTDADGHFCIESPSGAQTLSVMAVGFETVRQTVEVGATNEPLAVKLDAVDILGKSKQTGSASDLSPNALAPGGARPAFDEDALSIPEDAAVAMREAQRLAALATRDNTASGWDRAAEAWGKTAALMPAGAHRVDAMFQTADARYRAWKRTPNDTRNGQARKAFKDYLESAPDGPQRDRVDGWVQSLSD